MNEFEAIGELAQGGLTARAVEPAAGESSALDSGHTHEAACLNCGASLFGPHCHHCGQRAHVHRTLGAFFHDLLHGVLHFEGKVWRTLPLLAWRPGKLTREYIDGRRASYVSPIALFLFTIFVTFALWNALGGVGEINGIGSEFERASQSEFETRLAGIDAEIAGLEQDLAKARSAGGDTAGLAAQLEGKRKARRIMAAVAADAGRPAGTVQDASAGKTTAAEKEVGGWLEAAWHKVKADPALLIYKLQTNAYKLSWLLIPLSLPFLWLVFPFSRRFRMYDHTVFVTYSISFMTMLVVVASLGGYLGFAPLVIAPLLYAPAHLYWHLRGTYGLSRFGAVWRLLVLSVVIYLVLALFILIMLALVIR
jgi:hypothetical protein